MLNVSEALDALEDPTVQTVPPPGEDAKESPAAEADEEVPAAETAETVKVADDAATDDVTAAEDAVESDATAEPVNFDDLLQDGKIKVPGDEAEPAAESADQATEDLRQLLLTGDSDLDDPKVSERILGAALRTTNGQQLLNSGKLVKQLEVDLGYEPSAQEMVEAFKAQQDHRQLLDSLGSAHFKDPASFHPVLTFLVGDKENPQQDAAESLAVGILPFFEENHPDLAEYVLKTAALDFAERLDARAPFEKDESVKEQMPKVAGWIRRLLKEDGAPAKAGPSDGENYWKQRYEDDSSRRVERNTDLVINELHASVIKLVDGTFRPYLERAHYADRVVDSVVADIAKEVSSEIADDKPYASRVVREIQRGSGLRELGAQHDARTRTVLRKLAPKRLPELITDLSAGILEKSRKAHARRRNGVEVSGAGAAGGSAAEPRPAIEKKREDESPHDFLHRALDSVAERMSG